MVTLHHTMDDNYILYSGWLTKRGASIKNWKVRYFVLCYNYLKYYVDDNQQIQKGVIKLSDVLTLNRRCPPLKSPIFEITIPGRCYTFQAVNIREMEMWIAKLHEADKHIIEEITPAIIQKGIIKEGILNKRGQDIFKQWKTRKFVLVMFPEEQLLYFTPDEQKLKGSIELRDIIQVTRNNNHSTKDNYDNDNIFHIETINRIYKLQADTASDMNEWIQLITAATRDALCQAGSIEIAQLTDARERSSSVIYDANAIKECLNNMKVLKQGWLLKKGNILKVWRWRYFVLQMNSVGRPILRYYNAPDTTVTRGSIDIGKLQELNIDNNCLIELKVDNTTFKLQAESDFIAQEWIAKIHFAQKEQPDEY